MHPALFWHRFDGSRAQCELCPRGCRLREGQTGFCGVRACHQGRMVSLAYGKPAAVNVDPIEKKPLYHFLPGSTTFSLGTAGCNLACKFCQNWTLSRGRPSPDQNLALPEVIIQQARRHGCRSIALTYNEPTVWFEYGLDIARLARAHGLMTVMVTNGYINPSPLHLLYQWIDAANIDLKSFAEDFYRRQTSSHLQPVLAAIEAAHRMGVWIELTTLLIPGLNDSLDEIRRLCRWVLDHLGDRTPIHFSAFHPDHRMRDRLPTPPEALLRARRQAMELGLRYVYVGNVLAPEASVTCCPECGAALISRCGWTVKLVGSTVSRCYECGAAVEGVWQ